jgi:hypothetical protein
MIKEIKMDYWEVNPDLFYAKEAFTVLLLVE